ncbi:MAG TPA: D-hexose-6-phosphate mutarotase [Polyangia bacterium]|nr:D-hexose-6-phosphate mutarotase [Polyangia bacterium]
MRASFRTGVRNGLPIVEVETAAATAAMALQGAQVLSFVPRGGRDWLWVSERARWAAGTALRGGIPICFPWFGPHPTERAFPAHGFARTRPWRLVATDGDGDGARLELGLTADAATEALFPHRFEARLTVTVGADLTLAFEAANAGAAPFAFEVALHSYFAVADVAAAAIDGLAGCAFVDKVAGGARRREGEAPVRIAGEVDRVYDAGGPVTLVDPAGGRALRIETAGGGSTVVWNPAPAKAAALGDLAPDGWRRFVCVESGAVGDRRITLAPGARHRLTARIAAGPG